MTISHNFLQAQQQHLSQVVRGAIGILLVSAMVLAPLTAEAASRGRGGSRGRSNRGNSAQAMQKQLQAQQKLALAQLKKEEADRKHRDELYKKFDANHDGTLDNVEQAKMDRQLRQERLAKH